MGAQATLRFTSIPPRKARYVLDQIRGRSVEDATQTLTFSRRRASKEILKLLNSAVANAAQTGEMDLDVLYVKEAYANEGPTLKRIAARAQGRAYPIFKRTCHITIVLEEK